MKEPLHQMLLLLKYYQKPVYKKAIQEVSKIISKNDPSLTSDLVDSQAKEVVLSIITKKTVDEGLSPEASLNAFKQGFVQGAEAEGKGRFSLINLSEDLFRKRSKYFDKAPSLRELLNEVRDPKAIYIKTISDLSNFVTANKFLTHWLQVESLIVKHYHK